MRDMFQQRPAIARFLTSRVEKESLLSSARNVALVRAVNFNLQQDLGTCEDWFPCKKEDGVQDARCRMPMEGSGRFRACLPIRDSDADGISSCRGRVRMRVAAQNEGGDVMKLVLPL
jgi:hypothetical protein